MADKFGKKFLSKPNTTKSNTKEYKIQKNTKILVKALTSPRQPNLSQYFVLVVVLFVEVVRVISCLCLAIM